MLRRGVRFTMLPLSTFGPAMRQVTCWRLFLAGILALSVLDTVQSDELVLVRQGSEEKLQGEILEQAQDGSLLFRTLDARLWIIQADEIKSKIESDDEVVPLTPKQLGQQLLKELPDGFKIHINGDFVIAYNTERAYAQWIGGLYQRLQRGFEKYWQRKKMKLVDPDYPLAVIIFADKLQYERYLTKELGDLPGVLVAYYNLLNNRVAMYDLTGGQRAPGARPGDDRRIAEVLSNPRAIPMVATVIHEGTHQLMFNMGMQTRFSDTPLWINEGLAMYFETPDLSNPRGWRAIGQINPMRIGRFRQLIGTRDSKSLGTMLSRDTKFRDPNLALDAYAEAWAFNYFLLNKYPEEYVNFLKHMSKKPRLKYDTPETRLNEFLQFFKQDLPALDREFVQYIQKQ